MPKPPKPPKPPKLGKLTMAELAAMIYYIHTGKLINATMLDDLVAEMQYAIDNLP